MTMTAMDPALTDAYDTCRRMHRRHDPTYYWATRRLPADVRPATHALYGYVRTADQLVDGPRRAPTPDARRAALDAWEGELARGLQDGALGEPRRGRARRRGPPPRPAAVGARRRTCARCASTARPCGSPAGRSSSPTWRAPPARSGGSWRRCSASPSATTPTTGGSGSRSSTPTSSATSPRTTGWTASTSRRRTASASAWRRRTSGARAPRRSCARSSSTRSRRARALFAAAAPGRRRRARLGAAGHPARLRGLRVGARPRRGGRLRRARPPHGRPLLAAAAARLRGAAAVTRRATLRGAERTPLGARARGRADLRRELRRPRRRPRAGRLRRRRAGGRPLRDRRARDLGLRRADAVAARDGRRARDPPGDPVHGLPHAARLGPLPAAVELELVRLPRAVPRAVGAVRRRALRDREGRGSRRARPSTPTAATSPRR